MQALRYAFPIRLAAAAIAMIVAGQSARAGADEACFFGPLRTVAMVMVASTVPANADLNPYGIALVKKTLGALRRGSVLISSFNDAAKPQGTGTTIVAVDVLGQVSQFARIDAARLKGACPGSVGLTTALGVLERDWVIVGSLPSATGWSAKAKAKAKAEAGCLIALDAQGRAVTTWYSAGINAPWDLPASDQGDSAQRFVSTVLNGDVTSGAPHLVNAGAVRRIGLEIAEQGAGSPRRVATTVIAAGLAQTADPANLVIDPTGVALSWDGASYVADSRNNRIGAIADAQRFGGNWHIAHPGRGAQRSARAEHRP